MNRFTIAICCAALLTVSAMAGAQTADPPEKPERKKTVQDVVRMLAEEGRTFRETGKWPRERPDFRTTSGIGLEDEVVIAQLGRTLDRDPAVDGYIKWQLLSYRLDLRDLPGSKLGRIVRGLPRLVDIPKPSRSQLKLFNKVDQMDQIPTGTLRARVDREMDTWQQAQDAAELANHPAYRYRLAIIDKFPKTDAYRVIGRMQDLEDRIKAGDYHAKQDLSKKLIADALMIKKDREVSGRARMIAKRQLDRLRKLEVPNYYWRVKSRYDFVNGTLSLYHKHADEVEAYLMGKEYLGK